MPTEPTRFPYNPDRSQQEGSLPFLPIQLQFDTMWVQTTGLGDSGASINVIPYAVGLQLGAIGENQGQEISLGGNLASAPAKGILLNVVVGPFAPVRLVFAWSRFDDFPTILGQMNFFQAFKVSFIGAEKTFDIAPYH